MIALEQPRADRYVQGSPGRNGLVSFVSNAELDDQLAEREAETTPQPEPLNGISQHIKMLWDDAIKAKSDIEKDLVRDLAQRKGEYTDEEKAIIDQQREPLVYDNVTEVKASAAVAWISDVIQFRPGEQPFALDPSPKPDLPPEIIQAIAVRVTREFLQAQLAGQLPTNIQSLPPQQQQQIADMLAQYAAEMRTQIEAEMQTEAKSRAERMEQKISDQLAEGAFEDAFDDFLEDFGTYRTAFLDGPVVRRVKKPAYVQDQNGKTFCVTQDEIAYEYSCVSPFDVYPLKNARTMKDGYVIRRRYSRADLEAMMGTDGVDDEAVRLVLTEYQSSGYQTFQSIDSQRATLQDRGFTYMEEETVEGLELWAPVRGHLLNEYFGEPRFVAYRDYEVSAIVAGDRTIKICQNPDPCGDKPLHAASYRRVNGSIWGRSIPWLMRDKQKIINACVRALCRNMGFASGPMAWFDPDALPAGMNIEELHPLQLIQLKKRPDGGSGKPIEFFKIDSHAQELIGIRDKVTQQCDDATGIPPYTYGSDKVAGAGKTMGGLSMLLTASTRGIKKGIANIDKFVIKPLIRRQWTMNMLYDADETIKGDVNIVARGALALFVKEQTALRRMEILSGTNNPVDMQIFGLTGRANLWREMFKSVNLSPEGVIPTEQELNQRLQLMAMKQNAAANMQQKRLAAQRTGDTPNSGNGADAQQSGNSEGE